MPLCGHATLASAAALFFGEDNPARQLVFDTLSGELVVTRQAAGEGAGSSGSAGGELLSMDLPLIQAGDVPPGMEAVVQVREVAQQLSFLSLALSRLQAVARQGSG